MSRHVVARSHAAAGDRVASSERAASSEAGAAHVGWVVRLAAFLLVVGVLGYDGFAIMSTRIKGENDAQNAAYAASQNWQAYHNVTEAYQAAQAYVAGKPEQILTRGFAIDSDNTVHLLLRRTASTLVFSRVAPLRKYTVATLHGDDNANPP